MLFTALTSSTGEIACDTGDKVVSAKESGNQILFGLTSGSASSVYFLVSHFPEVNLCLTHFAGCFERKLNLGCFGDDGITSGSVRVSSFSTSTYSLLCVCDGD